MCPKPRKLGSKKFKHIKKALHKNRNAFKEKSRQGTLAGSFLSSQEYSTVRPPCLSGSQSNRSLWHAHFAQRFKGSIISHLENADSSARRVQRVEEFPIIAQGHIDRAAAFSCKSSLCFEQTDASVPFDAIAGDRATSRICHISIFAVIGNDNPAGRGLGRPDSRADDLECVVIHIVGGNGTGSRRASKGF